MSFLQKMTQKELLEWIQSLATDESFSAKVKQQIISGIEQYEKEEGSAVTGEDFFDADEDDIKLMCNVDKKKAKVMLRKISAKKQEDFEAKKKEKGIPEPGASSSTSSKDKPFTLNIQAIRSKMYKIKNVSRSTTIADVKERFLRELGDDAAADQYQGKLSKWNKKSGKIELKKSGTNMQDDKTLGDYGIINGMHMPLIVSFKVSGGANYESKSNDNDDDDDADKYRTRKLRTKKYKEYIKLSSKPDCIMGYNDADGILRAEMPCGCVFASDTMYRFMKSLFEKNYNETKAICPMPIKQCQGNEKQRVWPWALVFVIADLSEKEVGRYTKVIENRISGSKNCPHCDAVTERPDDLRISRVRCNVCNNRDWCWNCLNVWNASGLGPICGNKNCMGAEINNILQNCGTIDAPSNWEIKNKGKPIPKTRACPKCLSPLEYVQACKHIWCICCPHQFCFNCLGDWKSGSEFSESQCGHNKICDFTKIQSFT